MSAMWDDVNDRQSTTRFRDGIDEPCKLQPGKLYADDTLLINKEVKTLTAKLQTLEGEAEHMV